MTKYGVGIYFEDGGYQWEAVETSKGETQAIILVMMLLQKKQKKTGVHRRVKKVQVES